MWQPVRMWPAERSQPESWYGAAPQAPTYRCAPQLFGAGVYQSIARLVSAQCDMIGRC
jgi:hypothetical protein